MNTENPQRRPCSASQPKRITIYFPREDTSDSMVPEQIEKMKQSLKRIQHDALFPADAKENPQK
ncbi:MAG TPA: hypothetical protein IAA80_07930 [Candidatus Gallacutalibacter pullistercoris]|nr:hypothetical protein [Candidatus Gallacutalibacter pullistercoris]